MRKIKFIFFALISFVALGCNSISNISDDVPTHDPRCGHIHKASEPCPVDIPEPPVIPFPHNQENDDMGDKEAN